MSHRPRKRFGQNFLHDPGVVARIVGAIAPRPGERIVEIGPGQGAMTGALLAAAGCLTAIEIDRDLCQALRRDFEAEPGFDLHQGDALSFDFTSLADGSGGERLRVVGNLPYNISTPILFRLLAQRQAISDMHFMLQKEVVDRLTAAPGSKAYGRLGVMVQLDCKADALFTVGAGAFRPAPKVTSAVVRLTVREAPAAEVRDRAVFATVVRDLFSKRRKSLRASLKSRLTATRIEALGIDPRARPETLDLAAFAALANAVQGV